jgi:hypothetical protein
MKAELSSAFLALFLMSCVTAEIPPEKAVWADGVRAQIALASETNYVYVPVANKQETKIVERLAFKQGKDSQQTERDGGMAVCVFVYDRERFLLPGLNLQ